MGTNGYANPDALVETEWLQGHLDDPSVRVVEVDEDVTAYATGHIPGAVRWNWQTDLRAVVGRDFIDQEGLTGLLRAAGVNPDTTVVLYAGNNNWFAAYAYWLLKYLGFDAVKLLNGGRKKWELESLPLTDETPSYAAGMVALDTSVRSELRAFRNQVLARLRRGVFIDVRSPEEYRGEKLAPDHLPQEQSQVPGHIPGAVNIPWSKAANGDGTFRSAEDLRVLYEGAGVTPDNEVIAYCRIGERSAHTWFALTQLLGYPDVKNYDGSWTEYGSLVGVPVEKD
jgi:thiosulfate/3-mercaptopyruvate sulfurtransferase